MLPATRNGSIQKRVTREYSRLLRLLIFLPRPP
jgi:hypothetical protein